MARLSAPAYRVWTQGLMHAQEYRTDGFIAAEDVEALGRPIPREDWVAELIVSGLWEEVAGGYLIHDYLQWNDPSAKRAAKDAKNREAVARWRERQKALRSGQKPAAVAPVSPAVSAPVAGSLVVPVERGRPLTDSPIRQTQVDARYGFIGPRFRVPMQFHQELVGRYGGDFAEAEVALQKWYRSLEATVPQGESIPNIYQFINGHFAAWVAKRAAAVPVAPAVKRADDQRQGVTDDFRDQLAAAQERKARA